MILQEECMPWKTHNVFVETGFFTPHLPSRSGIHVIPQNIDCSRTQQFPDCDWFKTAMAGVRIGKEHGEMYRSKNTNTVWEKPQKSHNLIEELTQYVLFSECFSYTWCFFK